MRLIKTAMFAYVNRGRGLVISTNLLHLLVDEFVNAQLDVVDFTRTSSRVRIGDAKDRGRQVLRRCGHEKMLPVGTRVEYVKRGVFCKWGGGKTSQSISAIVIRNQSLTIDIHNNSSRPDDQR